MQAADGSRIEDKHSETFSPLIVSRLIKVMGVVTFRDDTWSFNES
jgi:hypothetical protein